MTSQRFGFNLCGGGYAMHILAALAVGCSVFLIVWAVGVRWIDAAEDNQ